MKSSRISIFILIVSLLSLVSITISNKPFPNPPDQTHHSKEASFVSKQEKRYYIGVLTRLGSIPPNCAHRCKRCVPCVAVQMPTTTDHIEVRYANYEPEGWRCMCGSSFFNP